MPVSLCRLFGLIEDAEGLMTNIDDTKTMDAARISLAQAVELCKIARYSTRGDLSQSAWPSALLKTTLDEKYGAEEGLAEERLNAAAEARAKTWWDGALHRHGRQPRWGTHCFLARLDDTTRSSHPFRRPVTFRCGNS